MVAVVAMPGVAAVGAMGGVVTVTRMGPVFGVTGMIAMTVVVGVATMAGTIAVGCVPGMVGVMAVTRRLGMACMGRVFGVTVLLLMRTVLVHTPTIYPLGVFIKGWEGTLFSVAVLTASHARSGGRSTVQPVLLGAMLAIAVIMGLLTMCTPSTAAASPDAAPASSVAAHSTHAVGGEHSVAPVTLDDGHNGHMAAMACVMALLAFMVVLALPRESRARLSQPAPANRAATLPWSVPRGRPSLLFLCISRT